MADMTEEEAWALDEYWTKHTPKLSGDGKNGFFVKNKGNLVFVDDGDKTHVYLKPAPPQQIPHDTIREKITVSV